MVDVWTLAGAQPAAEPEPEEEKSGESGGMSPIWTGAIAGAVAGCWARVGAALASPSDITPGGLCVLNGAFFAGVGAGAVALVRWVRRP